MRFLASLTTSFLLVLSAPLFAADFSCATSTTARTYLAGGESVDAGDFDDDGTLDVLASNRYGVSVLYGRGDGTLGEPVELAKQTDREWFGDVAAADVNGDGRDDVIFVRWSSTFEIVVLRAAGSRSFDAPVIIPHSSVAYGAKLEVADVTRDGRLDIIAMSGSIVTFVNEPDGSFTRAGATVAAPAASRFAVTDVDADGRPDIVIGDPGWMNGMQVFRGTPTGGFVRAFGFGRNEKARTITADMNGDGRDDVVALYTSGRRSHVRH